MARDVSPNAFHIFLNTNLYGSPGQKTCEWRTFCSSTEFQTHIHVPSSAYTAHLFSKENVERSSACQPAYFVYLLRFMPGMSPQGEVLPIRFLSLANAVIAIFVLSLGPFILMGQLPQLASRLFPFKRGLNHAYWAPNAWALVTAADRVLLRCGFRLLFLYVIDLIWGVGYADVRRAGFDIVVNSSGIASTSRGLVGDTVFAVIPNIKASYTFIITIAFQAVSHTPILWQRQLISRQIFLTKLWRTPTYKSFLTALTLCGYVSFMFGWHVHEKAVLLVLVPLRY